MRESKFFFDLPNKMTSTFGLMLTGLAELCGFKTV
jgi:hypothetical protein